MKRTDLYKELSDLIDYIDDHLEEPMTLDHLAQQVSISKFHLTRLFKVMSDKNLVEYVRSRKLAHSLKALIHTNEKIIDIAIRLGFEYEQSFIRSFKNEFGMTPHQYRLGDQPVEYVKKMKLEDVKSLENGFWLTPKIQMLKPFEISGISHTLNRGNVYSHWHHMVIDFWKAHIGRKTPPVEDFWGLCFRTNPSIHEYTYVTGIHRKHYKGIGHKEPSHFKHYAIQATEYAVFRYIGHHGLEELTALKLDLFSQTVHDNWMCSLGYNCRTPMYMVIDRIPTAFISDTYCEFHVYVPIANHKNTVRIRNLKEHEGE